MACGTDLFAAPITELRDLLAPEAAEYFPPWPLTASTGGRARDPVTSPPVSATTPSMNLRAAYSYWYFSTGSRWQPKGAV